MAPVPEGAYGEWDVDSSTLDWVEASGESAPSAPEGSLEAKFAAAGPPETGPGGIPRRKDERQERMRVAHPERVLEPTYVPTHLARAVIAHLLCPPLGLVAAILAGQVSLLERSGNVPGAWETSKRAKSWAHAGLGVGIVGWGSALLIHLL